MIFAHLAARHDRRAFDCGVEDMNRFLKEQTRQDAERGLSRTLVNLADDGIRILGYYTLALGFLDFDSAPEEKRLSRHPAPVILLARLAVDKDFQAQGVGRRLLYDAQARAVEITERIGLYAMTLDAREERLCAYYERYGFKRRADGPLRMYKTMAAIRKLGLRAAPLE
ncbi:MAG: GNAT family N-acetyltransferase [Armatimonadetes bacterium]|nr:GNAT family N-acetyltransferase [Armatimonadota bacterium]